LQFLKEAAMNIGERIKAGRLSRGWTQYDLAEQAGISRRTVASIELGQSRGCEDTLAAINAAFAAHPVDAEEDSIRLAMDLRRAEVAQKQAAEMLSAVVGFGRQAAEALEVMKAS
tara:strand:- start:2739 stop:3083 length:345 start_codon:yes stop_codon:yes gene_type:complete